MKINKVLIPFFILFFLLSCSQSTPVLTFTKWCVVFEYNNDQVKVSLFDFISVHLKIGTFLMLPPQRLLSNNHNMHVSPQTVKGAESVFGFDFFQGQIGVGDK